MGLSTEAQRGGVDLLPGAMEIPAGTARQRLAARHPHAAQRCGLHPERSAQPAGIARGYEQGMPACPINSCRIVAS